MTVAELLSRISSKELMEWMAFEQLEPFGYEQEMLGHAITATTIANVNRGKDQKPYKIEDFLPKLKYVEEKPEQTVEDTVTAVKLLNITFGGIDKRKPK
jgi:hypothetical protein